MILNKSYFDFLDVFCMLFLLFKNGLPGKNGGFKKIRSKLSSYKAVTVTKLACFIMFMALCKNNERSQLFKVGIASIKKKRITSNNIEYFKNTKKVRKIKLSKNMML